MSSEAPHRVPASDHQGHRILPTTTLGRRALWFAIASALVDFAWMILPGGAALAFACGLVGGVYLAVLPMVLVLIFVLAELLIGHD